MQTLSPETRRRLEIQGFVGMSDQALTEIRPWLRLSPAITATWMAMATLLASAKLMWAMIPFSLLGAVLPGHPFDVFYNFGIRFLLHRPPLPRYHLARRICCLVASLWMAGTGWAFAGGATTLGYVLGALFVAAASLPVLIDFCLPSYLYSLIFGKPAACSAGKV
ncbi:DUF4395 family protein [candidate division KSB1 bacterium]|nr:DUF4395 domain-containing protein [bacterium]NUM65480.1 DUF4395 family protein [candidate division KSB1 bacterium]